MAKKTIAENVEARTEVLMQELAAVRRSISPDDRIDPFLNDRLVFEGWAMQKIAGLQLICINLQARLDGKSPSDEMELFAGYDFRGAALRHNAIFPDTPVDPDTFGRKKESGS